MMFEMRHSCLRGTEYFNKEVEYFTEKDAPDWITSVNSIKGSTMDNRWFWSEHVLMLEVGQSIETDFRYITRVR